MNSLTIFSGFKMIYAEMFIFCLLILTGSVHSQYAIDEKFRRSSYGLFGGYNMNLHHADFRALPNVPNCCPRFGNDYGSGFALGALYDIPLSDMFSMMFRLGYSSKGATLTSTETTTVLIDNEDAQGVFEHMVKTDLSSLGIESLLSYRFTDRFRIHIGARAAFMLKTKFSQKETLIEPEDRGTFPENNLRIRNVHSGDIHNANKYYFAAVAGIGYLLPLNNQGTLFMSPELFYSHNISPLVSQLTWNAHSVRAGIAIYYMPARMPMTLPPPAEPPNIETERPPEIYVNAVGIDESGREISNPVIQIEELIGTQMQSLLPYVYFDQNSSTLRERYTRINPEESTTFAEEKLYNFTTLPTYYHILNIIGKRMRDFPEAMITLVGCNSDEGIEKGNLGLSRQRVETTRRYLNDIWGIPESRMKTDLRNLPQMYSTINEQDGIEENRRVEIHSADWNILKPVMTTDTLRKIKNPTISFKLNAKADAGIDAWILTVSNNQIPVKSFEGKGMLPDVIRWDILPSNDFTPHNVDHLQYTLTVRDNLSRTVITLPGIITIDKLTLKKKRLERLADKYIDRYALILFDFDKSDIRGFNNRIVEIIKNAVQKNSTIFVSGYTDRIGESNYNKSLSEKRAKEVFRFLECKAGEAVGIGEDILLFNNALPEGRTYCRTVIVEVETPVEYDSEE